MFIWAGGKRENVIFRNPSTCALTYEEAAPYDEIWFADVCPQDLTDAAGGKPFRVFDHHVSNQRKHGSDQRCMFDMTRSGTSLMAHVLGMLDYEPSKYDYFRDLVEALEAYDLGRFDHYHGMRLADIASSYSQEQLLELMSECDPDDILYNRELTSRAEALSAVRKLYADKAFAGVRWDTIPDGDCGAVKAGLAVSPVYWKNEVANRILSSGKADVAVIFDVTGGMVSLRSNPGGPDCSKIAELYGGGGHARAAGFKAKSWAMLKVLMNEVFG